jgi:hypothetical protein
VVVEYTNQTPYFSFETTIRPFYGLRTRGDEQAGEPRPILPLSETKALRAFLNGREKLLPQVLLAFVLGEVQLSEEER